ncbi:uncharacterized protein CLUP02_09810 [Colletotrichum lupini]|uniref:Uncharacterized protein n=1 Tax=Colletotrichum lupini TaxID=145971 RepID=A0A9Q8SVF0_9PEZI|nr:uncharacterized protein CLUP02_09810 [Colletotrichum lupini]UQC84314.1 hypothetical protein CLUP02_09810 [Colletotrichum lupini]
MLIFVACFAGTFGKRNFPTVNLRLGADTTVNRAEKARATNGGSLTVTVRAPPASLYRRIFCFWPNLSHFSPPKNPGSSTVVGCCTMVPRILPKSNFVPWKFSCPEVTTRILESHASHTPLLFGWYSGRHDGERPKPAQSRPQEEEIMERCSDAFAAEPLAVIPQTLRLSRASVSYLPLLWKLLTFHAAQRHIRFTNNPKTVHPSLLRMAWHHCISLAMATFSGRRPMSDEPQNPITLHGFHPDWLNPCGGWDTFLTCPKCRDLRAFQGVEAARSSEHAYAKRLAHIFLFLVDNSVQRHAHIPRASGR